MDRMKTFGIYALCIILFFIFSNIMIDIAIKATYYPIDIVVVTKDDFILKVNEAKATYVNGYVEGNVRNIRERL